LVGDDIGGIAVHIAARVLGQAGAGEIVCSRTVKDLVAGAGFAFTDANHCTESRSHRTWSRLKQPSHDSDRSAFQRCRPSLPAILDPGGVGRSRR
jgi:class 3 adenylate cyclase